MTIGGTQLASRRPANPTRSPAQVWLAATRSSLSTSAAERATATAPASSSSRPRRGFGAVQRGGVQPGDGELAEQRQDEPVHVAAVVVDRPRRDGPHALAPFEPPVQQLGHGPLVVASVSAGGRLCHQARLKQLGLGPGRGRPALAELLAGHRVAAEVDDDPPTSCLACRSRVPLATAPEDTRLPSGYHEASKASTSGPLTWSVGSPRSDSNRRPSDYETDVRRRSGWLQTDLDCSRWMPRRFKRLQTDTEGSSG
jgi:hypothetical protein